MIKRNKKENRGGSKMFSLTYWEQKIESYLMFIKLLMSGQWQQSQMSVAFVYLDLAWTT